MPRENVVRIFDYERRSRSADAQAAERGQCEADVIVMPSVRIEQDGRAAIVAEARSWIGTPYADHAEVKGRNGGTDCAKLIKCCFVGAGIIEDFVIPYYSPQHFLHSDHEWYIEVILTFAREIAEAESKPGDVVTYKMGRCHGHGAIIIDPGFPAIVHAWAPARMVVRGDGLQEGLGDRWRERRFFSHW